VYGDLSNCISCYFDTQIGAKRETKSYEEITLSLGADSPSDILFLTDIIEEAQAARSAGLDVILSVRPGNAPLPEKHDFPEFHLFAKIV
jgi:methylthioribulose 1-phosphate dehydratase/enolase-phosphatase E1